MRRGRTLLRVAVSAALIAWILRGTDLREVWETFRTADVRYILLAIALIPLGYLSSVSRWRLLLRAQGGDAPYPFLVRSLMTGIFFNNFLPSTIGGDAIRAWDTARSGVGKATALTIIMVDRFVGLLALLVFAAVGLLGAGRLTERVPELGWWVLGVGGVMVVVAVVLFRPRSPHPSPARGRGAGGEGSKLSQVTSALFSFRGHGRALAGAFFWSLCLQTLVVLNAWVQVRALHVELGLAPFFLIVPLAVFLMMIPVSINGIGVRENLFVFFLAAFGVAEATGLAFAWLEYGILLLQALAGGLVYAWGRERDVRRVREMRTQTAEVAAP
ncbi:MAG TPA: lysylphosphatidylglycerol synthase transmembrane domain-containing protein [Thermoanaerobaculia bacterium]|nr:lysylphosphatidylglycerol synthase transmembrane domain-containing protein [Thermoanaerobaculia bacterium]